jgi:hypothetical protein
MDEIKNRQAQRFRFLKHLYDKTHKFYATEAKHPATIYMVSPIEIGEELGFTPIEAEQIVRYLSQEGLVRHVTQKHIKIEHAGEKEVEAALTKPERPTEHFPANITQYIVTADQIINSPIQQGVQNSTQTISYSIDVLQKAEEFVELLKRVLPDLPLSGEDKAETQAEIATIESQLSSPRPKPTIIKASVTTIVEILKSIPANVAANIIVQNLPALPVLIENASELLKLLS